MILTSLRRFSILRNNTRTTGVFRLATVTRALSSKPGLATTTTFTTDSGTTATTATITITSSDGLDRWPHVSNARGFLRALDYAGTFIFSCSGSITAALCGLDVLGAIVVGTITAVGGGTLRDVIILRREPFWSGKDGENEYLWISFAGALFAFFLYPIVGSEAWPDDTAVDAISLGAFAVIGAMNGARAHLSLPLSILCGVVTATGGGTIRDVLTQRPIRILHSEMELYATCAAAGASAFLISRRSVPFAVAATIGVTTVVFGRFTSVSLGLRLPTWRQVGNSSSLLYSEKDV